MSFVDPVFPLFLAVVWALERGLRGAATKNAWLVVASSVFYGWVDPRLLLILWGSTLLDYVVALGMERRPSHARGLLAVSVAAHLGVLGWFKYAGWLLDSVVLAGRAVGVELDLPTVRVLWPLGLSFYTFQTMGYAIDVYRGRVRARRNVLTYLAFALFFPQLVSGPIGRAGKLLPQLEVDRRPSLAVVRSGLTLAAWGAFTKVVIADTLAPWVDATLLLPRPPGVLLWTTMLAFGLQIYADLSGYTNLARGVARMFGIELGVNFREPFLAASTPEFWRRWHVSVSGWARDFVLVPLMEAAEGAGPLRAAGPLVVTFLVMGVWHGAGWHYALFGLWHAAWSGVYLWVGPRVPAAWSASPWARAVAIVAHEVLVLLPGTVLFVSGGVARAFRLLATPPWAGGEDAAIVALGVAGLVGAGSALLLAEWGVRRALGARWAAIGTDREPAWVLPAQTTAWSVAALGLLVFHRIGARDFLYFRF